MANEIILGQSLDALSTNKIINLPNGTAPGDSVNFSQLSALIGGVTFIGPYDAATNAPDLVTPAVGAVLKGYMYVVNIAGTAFYGTQLEVGDIIISNVDNPALITDWTVAQSNNTVPVYDRVYFVSQEVGDDTNSGLSEFSQFATLNKALTVANAALPAASNSDRILIRITDGKSYDFGAGAVTLNGFINVHAPEARLTGNGTTPTVLSATFNSLEFGSIDGTDLTIKQVSGSGFGGILLRTPSIFNANNLINILTTDGASGDAISVEAQNISCIGTFATTDTGELYINGQLATLSVNDAADIPFVTCSGASTVAHLSISDLDGSNAGTGNVIGAESLAGAKIFARVGCNTLDIPWKADGAGSEIHAFGDIDNAPVESTGGIVYRNTQTEGVYFPNLPATGGLALTDLIKISKAGVAEKATLTELQTLLAVGSGGTIATAKVANYTAVAQDFVLMTTGATDKTVTLPAAAANTNAVIEVKKVDSGAGNVIIDGNGAETIDGLTTQIISSQYTSVTLHCDGTEWWIK